MCFYSHINMLVNVHTMANPPPSPSLSHPDLIEFPGLLMFLPHDAKSRHFFPKKKVKKKKSFPPSPSWPVPADPWGSPATPRSRWSRCHPGWGEGRRKIKKMMLEQSGHTGELLMQWPCPTRHAFRLILFFSLSLFSPTHEAWITTQPILWVCI